MSDGGARPRLLLIEDDARLGAVVRDVLSEVYAVTLAASAQAGYDAAARHPFDVLVVDRRLPDGDGARLIERLRAAGVVAPAVILSALGGIRDRVTGLDAGADDYLIKPFDFEELFARLRAVRRIRAGEGPFLRIGSWEFYPESRAVYSPYDGRRILTERETELLRLLAVHPSRTFTREAILREVFASTDRPGTVDTYVHYIRRKTDRDMVTTVRGRGYRLGQL